jgi:hypothetical protein
MREEYVDKSRVLNLQWKRLHCSVVTVHSFYNDNSIRVIELSALSLKTECSGTHDVGVQSSAPTSWAPTSELQHHESCFNQSSDLHLICICSSILCDPVCASPNFSVCGIYAHVFSTPQDLTSGMTSTSEGINVTTIVRWALPNQPLHLPTHTHAHDVIVHSNTRPSASHCIRTQWHTSIYVLCTIVSVRLFDTHTLSSENIFWFSRCPWGFCFCGHILKKLDRETS